MRNKKRNYSTKKTFPDLKSSVSKYTINSEEEKKLYTDNIANIQQGLDVIISYFPYFRIDKFLESSKQSLNMLVCILHDEIERKKGDKIKLLVESSYISAVEEHKCRITSELNILQRAKIKVIKISGVKAFITLKIPESKTEFTFMKNLSLVEKSWYLYNIAVE